MRQILLEKVEMKFRVSRPGRPHVSLSDRSWISPFWTTSDIGYAFPTDLVFSGLGESSSVYMQEPTLAQGDAWLDSYKTARSFETVLVDTLQAANYFLEEIP